MRVSPLSSVVLEKNELIVREAWQIGPNDVDIIGIKEEDDVIIPRRKPCSACASITVL
jgi:hypothetical protein